MGLTRVTTQDIKDTTVGTADLAARAVTPAKIALSATAALEDDGAGQLRAQVDGSTIVRGGSGLAAKLDASGGLTSSASGLKTLLDTNPGLQLLTTGLSLKLDTNPGLQLASTGLSVKLDTTPGLQLTGTGLSVKVDPAGGLGVAAAGAGITALTAKGDLLTFSTTPLRLPRGNDGEALHTDSSQTTGLRWMPRLTFKNRLINGGFDVWQRVISNGTIGIVADRWNHVGGTGGTLRANRVAFVAGQVAVPGEPAWYLQHDQQVAATAGLPGFFQKIEGVRTFAGQTCTLSFWAQADAARTCSVQIFQNFGSGGSATPAATSTNFNATALWTKFTITATLPSILGLTIGTAADNINVYFVGPLNTAWTLKVTQVQLEAGPLATAYEVRPPQMELALCQRFYSKSYQQSDFPGAVTDVAHVRYAAPGTAGEYLPMVTYPVEMRAAPTITFYSNATGASGKRRNLSAGADEVQATTLTSGLRGFGGGAGHTAGQVYGFHWTAEAEL